MDFNEKLLKAKKIINSKRFENILNKFYRSPHRYITNTDQFGVMTEEDFEDIVLAIYYNAFPNIEEDMEGLEELVRYEEIILIKMLFPLDTHTTIVKSENFDKIMLSKKLNKF